MKKLENFSNCLKVLKTVDFPRASEDDIYRMGVIGQFNLTFELAWKALQALLREHSVSGAETGSPRDILKAGYRTGYLSDSDTWLLMLKKRNLAMHVYHEQEIDELISLIRDRFIPALVSLEALLQKKAEEAESETWE